MLRDNLDLVDKAINTFSDHSFQKSQERHISRIECN